MKSFQSLSPILAVILPALFSFYCVFTECSSMYSGLVQTMIQIWVSACKPLATILVIANYRQFLSRKLCGNFGLLIVPFSSSNFSAATNLTQTRVQVIQQQK